MNEQLKMKHKAQLRQNKHDAAVVAIIVIVTLSIVGFYWLVWNGGVV